MKTMSSEVQVEVQVEVQMHECASTLSMAPRTDAEFGF